MLDDHLPTETNRTASGRRIVEAFAEHCYEATPGAGDFTRITLRAPHRERGSVFVALAEGWLADGTDYPIDHHGIVYRLKLTPPRDTTPWWRRQAEVA